MTLAACMVVAAWIHPAAAQQPIDLTLPNLGEPADVALSPAKSREMGEKIVAEMYQANYIVSDPQLGTYLDSIGWKLAYYGSKKPPDFHFYLIADNGINAFALPGANIGVNAGTIVAADNESELASVMAHEEAHVTQRHIARSANQSPIESLATWAAVIAAIIAASGNPSAIIGGLIAGQSINAQREIGYTRGHEMEADRVGIRTLAAAGYDPMAMAEFFGRLQRQARLYGRIPQLLLDHPVNTTRIAEATERGKKYPKVTPPYSVTFHLLRARARVLETDVPTDALTYFSNELGAGHDTPGNHYGDAMTLQTMGEPHKALAALQPLLERYPNQRNVLMLQAQLLLAIGKQDAALAIDRKVLDKNPNYAPIILQTAKALIRTGAPREARTILISHDQSYTTNPETYELLARAAKATGDMAEAAYQMANYLDHRGNPLGALDKLNAGLRLTQISANDRARLRARREQLIASIPAKQLRDHQRARGSS